MSAGDQKPKQTLLHIGNRWVDTIYTNYSAIMHRILLEILASQRKKINDVRQGKKVASFFKHNDNSDVMIELDMSRICTYDNYTQVRAAMDKMCKQTLGLYDNPEFTKPVYALAMPLLHRWEPRKVDGKEKKGFAALYITRPMMEAILFVHYGRPDPKQDKVCGYHWTSFHLENFIPPAPEGKSPRYNNGSKYLVPFYLMLKTYGTRGARTILVSDLRKRLQCEEKYKDFSDFHEYVLKYMQKAMGNTDLGFNYSLNPGKGRTIASITFKIFKNGEKYDYNHPFNKIQRALHEENKFYMQFTEDQHELLQYVLNGTYDLEAVYKKLQHIHDQIVKDEPVKSTRKTNKFKYTIDILHQDFPPPDI